MYSPVLGRFVNRDPLGYVDGNNLYSAYMVPNYVDPDGTETRWQEGWNGETGWKSAGYTIWSSPVIYKFKMTVDSCGKCLKCIQVQRRYQYEIFRKYGIRSRWEEERSWGWRVASWGVAGAVGSVGIVTGGTGYVAASAAAAAAAAAGYGTDFLLEDTGWTEKSGTRYNFETTSFRDEKLELYRHHDDEYVVECKTCESAAGGSQ